MDLYLQLLAKWRLRVNLTGPMSEEELLERCFFESFWATRALPRGARAADVGSGAGFPGLAMQLYRPDLRLTLIEPSWKKAAFLGEAVRRLNAGASVHCGKGEEFPEWGGREFAVMRALKPSERLAGLLEEHGVRLLALRGPGRAAGLESWRVTWEARIPGSRQRWAVLLDPRPLTRPLR